MIHCDVEAAMIATRASWNGRNVMDTGARVALSASHACDKLQARQPLTGRQNDMIWLQVLGVDVGPVPAWRSPRMPQGIGTDILIVV